MPISLPAFSRRRFLKVVGMGAGWLAIRPATANDANPNLIALLSDTHIPDAPKVMDHNFNMTERLRQVVREVAGLEHKPSCAVICGDLAWKTGTRGDYMRLTTELAQLQAAGIPLHMALGNHDNRAEFLAGVIAAPPKARPVDGKHVIIVELLCADLVLLDSLEPKHGSGGECGAAQLRWLGEALDRNREKPAVVFVHHNPQWQRSANAITLSDTTGLWDVLKPRTRVKALFFGHTHVWKVEKKDDIHLVNLPAVGYPFKDSEVTGWVDAKLTDRGMTMTMHSLEPKHALHMKATELIWR